MSRVERRWGQNGFLRFEVASGMDGGSKDRLDHVGVEICFPSHVVSNQDEFHGPFG